MSCHTYKPLEPYVTHKVFTPRYKDKNEVGQWICLIPVYKVEQGTAWQKIEFTKAKHLMGKRYCIDKKEVMEHCTIAQIKNKQGGFTGMYEIPESLWHSWQTQAEDNDTIRETIVSFGWMKWKDFVK